MEILTNPFYETAFLLVISAGVGAIALYTSRWP